jgi:hypothetical protein
MIRMIGVLDEPESNAVAQDRFGHMWIHAGDNWLPYDPNDGPGLPWDQLNVNRGPLSSVEDWRL